MTRWVSELDFFEQIKDKCEYNTFKCLMHREFYFKKMCTSRFDWHMTQRVVKFAIENERKKPSLPSTIAFYQAMEKNRIQSEGGLLRAKHRFHILIFLLSTARKI